MHFLPAPYLLHPASVHFPVALLTAGWFLGAAWEFFRRPSWTQGAARWSLWIGTLAAWAAMGLGLWAEDTVPHVPEAWRAMNTHRRFAFWTVGCFTVLSLWRYGLDRWGDRGLIPTDMGGTGAGGMKWERLFLAAWLAAIGALLATGYFGGELVFSYGVGFQKDG